VNTDEIRRLSARLFGNADRLHVAAAIGRMEGKPISVKAVAEESGLDYNRVQEQIARFRAAGVLVPDFDASMRRKDHGAILPPYWRMAAAILAMLEEAEFLEEC